MASTSPTISVPLAVPSVPAHPPAHIATTAGTSPSMTSSPSNCPPTAMQIGVGFAMCPSPTASLVPPHPTAQPASMADTSTPPLNSALMTPALPTANSALLRLHVVSASSGSPQLGVPVRNRPAWTTAPSATAMVLPA